MLTCGVCLTWLFRSAGYCTSCKAAGGTERPSVTPTMQSGERSNGRPGATLRAPEVAMTGSSLSSPETISGPLRDEAALESLFRTHFSALSQEAKSHLGESAA